jgi:hypothetical protein
MLNVGSMASDHSVHDEVSAVSSSSTEHSMHSLELAAKLTVLTVGEVHRCTSKLKTVGQSSLSCALHQRCVPATLHLAQPLPVLRLVL